MNREANQLTKSPNIEGVLNTSLLNIKRAEGHQIFDGGSNMKERDQKKLKKKMNSREIAIQKEEQPQKGKNKNKLQWILLKR